MESWKMAVVAGAIGTGVVLLLTGKKTAGIVLAGIGGAVLASEYPDKMEEIKDRLPEYADRGVRVLDGISRAGERIADLIEKRGRVALRDFGY
ncbi:MAG TPA: hypothetical protein VHL05_01390 [Terriglobales bacterium]|jgi:hypothetical protein|nr:hypothetical protein [Terriglobales bacterium]